MIDCATRKILQWGSINRQLFSTSKSWPTPVHGLNPNTLSEATSMRALLSQSGLWHFQVLYVKGYCPDVHKLRQLCPHLKTVYGPEYLRSDLDKYAIPDIRPIVDGVYRNRLTGATRAIWVITFAKSSHNSMKNSEPKHSSRKVRHPDCYATDLCVDRGWAYPTPPSVSWCKVGMWMAASHRARFRIRGSYHLGERLHCKYT